MGIEHSTLVLLALCSDQLCVASDHTPSGNSSNFSCSSGFKFVSPVCCGILSLFSLPLSALLCLSDKNCTGIEVVLSVHVQKNWGGKWLPYLCCSCCQTGLRSGLATVVDSLEQIMYLLPSDEEYSNFKLEKCLPSSLSSMSIGTLLVLMFKSLIMQS